MNGKHLLSQLNMILINDCHCLQLLEDVFFLFYPLYLLGSLYIPTNPIINLSNLYQELVIFQP